MSYMRTLMDCDGLTSLAVRSLFVSLNVSLYVPVYVPLYCPEMCLYMCPYVRLTAVLTCSNFYRDFA